MLNNIILAEAHKHFTHNMFMYLLDSKSELTSVFNRNINLCFKKPGDYISVCNNFSEQHLFTQECMTLMVKIPPTLS